MWMKLAIIGSRSFDDYEYFQSIIKQEFEAKPIELIISGETEGTGKLGERYAVENNIPKRTIYSEWAKYGKNASIMQSIDIVKTSDIILAFWDGQSSETKQSIDQAIRFEKDVIVKLVEA
jgi:hypothetical protein